MDSSNPYDSILLHALKKDSPETEKAVEEYRWSLASKIANNSKEMASSGSFPYCLCSLSAEKTARAVFIENISFTAKSVYISVLEGNDPEQGSENKSSSFCRKKRLRNEVIVLRCDCTEKKQTDWSGETNIKLLALLTDYNYRTLSSLKLISGIFCKEEEKKEGETMLTKDERIQYAKEHIDKKEVLEVILSEADNSLKGALFTKILRESRKKK
ncbi:hypothetical protein NEAUS03_1078 [Nematocida ausubeli]|nr:hypothetical protein NEAUS03_1078 [Nematocida ausubeli]